MADSAWVSGLAGAVRTTAAAPQHTAVVRITHWVTTLCFLALLAPLLHDRTALIVFAIAAVAAIALDSMPMRLSMICAGLAGIAAGVIADRVLGRGATTGIEPGN